ncbi:MAG TPA: hypothetical protein VK014_03445 [Cyclobacteriaceae bacterium]|nr:hypothetical protein [Cyclobacteriaceae bacterium]
MNRIIKKGLFLATILCCILVFQTWGQEEDIFGIERKVSGRKSESGVGNVFRNAISAFSLELSSGIGYHTNQLEFSSPEPESYPFYSLNDAPSTGDNGRYAVEDYAFPANIGLRLNLFDFFTLGGGYGRDFGKISDFSMGDQRLQLNGKAYTYDKLYGTFGLVLYNARRRAAFLSWRYRKYSSNNYYMQSELKQRVRQDYPWNFILEGEYGTIKLRKSYDSHLSATDPYYALGLRIEREFSEYARLFIKPTANFYKLNYSQNVLQDGLEVVELQPIKQNLYSLNVGLSISIPGTKRCKVAGCGVVMKHLHNGVEYRGSSIFKRQNRKVGQWYN